MTPMRALAAGLLAMAAVAALSSCEQRSGAPNANVLVIVIDTLRADHLGSYGYGRPVSPRIDGLAASGVRFANARSVSSWTLPSVASILTGLYPAVHGAEQSDSLLSDDVDSVAEDFSKAGYDTAAFSANAAFVTPRQGLARGFDRFDVLYGASAEPRTMGAIPADASLKSWVMEATAEDVTSAALEWLARRDSNRPFFLYVHYFDPHAAYTPPPELSRELGVRDDDPLRGAAQWQHLLADAAPSSDVLSTLVKLYDAEIAATDRAVGHLLDGLSAAVRESTVIVLTSDHGEEFGEHGGVQHGRTLFDELLRVPLLMTGPGIPRGRVVNTPVSLAALRATLTDLTHLSTERNDVIEQSFEPLFHRESDRPLPVFADLEKRFEADRQQHRRALIEGSWKLLLDPDRGSSVFDLSADPTERNEVSGAARADRLERMRTTVLDRDAAAVTKRAAAPPRRLLLDPAKREQLKALGYLQ